VVGHGGDFVSYAARFVDTYRPGCWMDPGPFGCRGAGPGQAIGAKLAHPDRQVCLLLGDGAFGFAGIEFDTMARHGLPVVGVMGNNGIWALEHHPMRFLYGYSVAAELAPETRYERMVEALGREGHLVHEPNEPRPALERAFESGRPTLGQRARRPGRGLSAQVEPRLTSTAAPTERESTAIAGGRFKFGPSGRAGVRLQGPVLFGGFRRREAPLCGNRPNPFRVCGGWPHLFPDVSIICLAIRYV